MKRKDFIITVTSVAVAVTITPILLKKCSGRKRYDPLIMPEMLGNFCNEQTIRGIGDLYRKQSPDENTKEKLTQLLLADNIGNIGKKITLSDKEALLELLERKVQKEFEAYQIIVLDGWIITKTEARQCALFSLS